MPPPVEGLRAPLREPFPGRADREAACRPLPNAGVTMDGIPEPHLEATVERRRLEPVILAVQDTTTLNHATLAATSGPDGPGGGGKGTDGIPAHRGVAPGGTGRPPGPFTPGEAPAPARNPEAMAGPAHPQRRGNPCQGHTGPDGAEKGMSRSGMWE